MQTISRGGIILALVALIFSPCQGWAQKDGPSESEVKSAFLYNFAKFVTWPSNVFAGPKAPLRVAIIGDSSFGRQFQETVQDRTVEGRPIEVRNFANLREIDQPTHLVFVADAERRLQSEILRRFQNSPVLTVGESDGFLEAGGVINFRLEQNRVRFEVNNKQAEGQGLKLSSKLISVAIRVIGARN